MSLTIYIRIYVRLYALIFNVDILLLALGHIVDKHGVEHQGPRPEDHLVTGQLYSFTFYCLTSLSVLVSYKLL